MTRTITRKPKGTLYAGVIFAVDFDGTCVTHDYPEVGKNIGAAPILRKLVAEGASIILWTMRSGKPLDDAVAWCKQSNIPLFGINKNPHQHWTTSPKAYAHHYIDDAALGVPLIYPEVGRPYVNWKAIDKLLFTIS